MSTGKYVSFVDSDDTVSLNYHLPMLLHAEKSGADIVVNDWAFRTDSSRYFLMGEMTYGTSLSLTDGRSLLAFTSQRGREQSLTVLWNKLYSRELLLRASVLLRERCGELDGFNYSEDALRNFFNFALAKKVENVHTGYYFYRQHPAQSVNAVSEEALSLQIERMSFALGAMYSYAEEKIDNLLLLSNISEWRALMSRTHFSYAKEAGYTALFPLISECYGVDKLRTATLSDTEVYATVKSLPDNLPEIDAAFLAAIGDGAGLALSAKKNSYTYRTAESLKSLGLIQDSGERTVSVPAERISFKNRVLRTPFVYKLAMLLFPKGSRIRAALKRKL